MVEPLKSKKRVYSEEPEESEEAEPPHTRSTTYQEYVERIENFRRIVVQLLTAYNESVENKIDAKFLCHYMTVQPTH